eukprot:CAMPEP_0116564728 /NCGR_PEP_ID=MMETSP0397-20121206/13487_1 /TAXON_ID=216820 /ORGANISM="Cyclophora tenuis, Strain ECT3854" /LENGTH=367 /DNA_ID=CAMNT_0004091389 /DNA_START=19 /DNA_END=1122 /DNA_ORIENTATION=+
MTSEPTATTKRSIKSYDGIVKRFVDYSRLAEQLPGGKYHFGHSLSVAHRQLLADKMSSCGISNNNNNSNSNNNKKKNSNNSNSNNNKKKNSNKTNEELSYLYTVREHSCLNGKELSGATLLALVDEISTGHIFSYDPRYKRPGVSVNLQNRICGPLPKVGTEISITSQITKMGRTMAFVTAQVRNNNNNNNNNNGDNNRLLCIASHIKYLPAGSWILDWLFTGWRAALIVLLVRYFYKVPTFDRNGTPLKDTIKSTLEHKGLGHASFQIQPQHCNPVGMFHGGCQGVLVEVVGQTLAKQELKSDQIRLESINVNYLGAGKIGKTVDVVANTIDGMSSPDHVTVEVRVSSTTRGKILSEAVLVWSKLT